MQSIDEVVSRLIEVQTHMRKLQQRNDQRIWICENNTWKRNSVSKHSTSENYELHMRHMHKIEDELFTVLKSSGAHLPSPPSKTSMACMYVRTRHRQVT